MARVSETAAEQTLVLLLRGFLRELGPPRPFTINSSLERDLGLGSLERVELLSRLEGEFQVRLPDSAAAEADTVSDLLRAVLAAEGRPLPEKLETAAETAAAPLPAPDSATNLLEVLYIHASADPERQHVLLRRDDGTEQMITYGELARRACRVASELRRRGVGAGDRVALMLPTSAEFFYSFMGVLLAQAIAVPIYPPFRADRIEDYATRQAGILRNAEAVLLITAGRGEALARLLRPGVPSLADVAGAERLSAEPGAGQATPWPALPRGGELSAFIQYTSGSTGNPKGVLLTHANLLANIRAVGQAIAIRPDDSGVSWLPLYHDMGLIGCWLLPLYFGLPMTILSPLAFLSRPERWLWAIHSRRATLSVGPNFAYDLCARKVRDDAIEGLNLNSWRAALNGSEAVRPETMERFTSRFARYGFRPEAMLPVYGLAESTVGLATSPLGRLPRVDRIRRDLLEEKGLAEPFSGAGPALAMPSVGRPLPEHEVRIVDAQAQVVGDRVQGRVQFRGPSTMAGYFRNPEATAEITCGEWLDTGDLGYQADGELFITGRSKDLILKAGRNLHPQEIESAVAEVDGVRKGCVTAFGVADLSQGTERLVVVAETRQQDWAERDRLRVAVSQRLMDLLGVPADDVVLLAPGTLPKTSSGKLRRTACRQAYERGSLGRRPPAIGWQWVRLASRWTPHALARAGRGAARLAYAAYGYPLFCACLLGCWVILLATPSGGPSARVLRLFTRLFLRLAGLRIDVDGLERLAPGPLALVANHASYLDVLVLVAALPRHLLFVAKKELTSMPVVRTIARKTGCLLVDRAEVTRSVADSGRIEEALRSGGAVLVFAEGTFTRERGLRPFKLGAFKAAAQAGCPVVPVAIEGSRQVLPDECWVPRPAPMKVWIRPPIHPGGNDWHEIIRLRDATFGEILAHCGEPRLEIVSAAIPGREE